LSITLNYLNNIFRGKKIIVGKNSTEENELLERIKYNEWFKKIQSGQIENRI
jgi:hypothetical protein